MSPLKCGCTGLAPTLPPPSDKNGEKEAQQLSGKGESVGWGHGSRGEWEGLQGKRHLYGTSRALSSQNPMYQFCFTSDMNIPITLTVYYYHTCIISSLWKNTEALSTSGLLAEKRIREHLQVPGSISAGVNQGHFLREHRWDFEEP
jgi:hypothetical protein